MRSLKSQASRAQRRFWILGAILVQVGALGQNLETVRVTAKPLDRVVELPGELLPYLSVPIHAKVPGFVDQVEVDRGSVVKEGQLLVTMIAPELKAQRAEAEAKVRTAEAGRVEAEARVVGAQSTYDRMKSASATPGVIAGNELIQAEKQVDAERARARAAESSVQAANEAVKAIEDLQAYLRIKAPFAGVITARNVHPGALVGTREDSLPLLQLETVGRLRLVVPVPEADVAGIVKGAKVAFSVPAYAGATFYANVSRIARSMDPKTRSMPVELDVFNSKGQLSAGMYPSVKWPVRGSTSVLLVPRSSIATNSERTFVIRLNGGAADWVDVKRGPAHEDLVEVSGALKDGDTLLRRATDEIRPGMHVNIRPASAGKSR